MNSTFWHARFIQQAQWTLNLRHHLYGRANLTAAQRVLEVGCGTGALLIELTMHTHGDIYGIDISTDHLEMAMHNLPGIPLCLGDAHELPFCSEMFDISFCHYLILWVTDPVQVVREMRRVTQPGGIVLALAEPDYGGRIDYPQELGILGDWQQTALRIQGADPLIGRKLRAIFERVDLVNVETGVLGGQWSGIPSPEDFNREWEVLEDDIKHIQGIVDTIDVLNLRELDKTTWGNGERVLFVPTFYAWGQVPGLELTPPKK